MRNGGSVSAPKLILVTVLLALVTEFEHESFCLTLSIYAAIPCPVRSRTASVPMPERSAPHPLRSRAHRLYALHENLRADRSIGRLIQAVPCTIYANVSRHFCAVCAVQRQAPKDLRTPQWRPRNHDINTLGRYDPIAFICHLSPHFEATMVDPAVAGIAN